MDASHLLIVAADAQLRDELQTAIASLGDRAPVPVVVDSLSKGLAATRNRAPDLIVVELSADLQALERFAQEVACHAPAALLAAVFRPETLAADAGETNVILGALRAGVKDFLRRPVSSAEFAELLLRHRGPGQRPGTPAGRVVSFISNKGGVGKSTLAVNSAVGLALRRPGRVLLVDASLQMGVAASMLDLRPRVTLFDAANQHHRLDETMLRQMVAPHDSGLHLLAAPADAVEAAAVDDEVISRIITLARRTYEFVVVDTFPLVDRVVMAVLDSSDRAYLVVENVVPTVLGAARLLEVLSGIGFPAPRLRVVLNRMTSIAGGLSAQDVAARLDCEIHAVLPYEPKVIAAANLGRPYVCQGGGWFGFGSRFRKQLQGLLRDLEAMQTLRSGSATPVEAAHDAEPARLAESLAGERQAVHDR